MFDCVIIGAGPAGATAAYHLAKRGKQVLLLDKAVFPRTRVCGGGISAAIAPWFDFEFDPVIETRIKRVRFSWQQGNEVTVKLQHIKPMWIVQRDRFDHFLVQQAQQQGATFQDQTAVTQLNDRGDRWQVETSQGQFEAKYIIAADGGNGPTAQWLGFPAPSQSIGGMLTVDEPVSEQQPAIAYFDFGSVKNGYIWHFPAAQGYTISAGIMRGKGKPKKLRSAVMDYATQFGLNPQEENYQEYELNLWREAQPLHTDRALLVGEAAGIIDPLSGEGVRPAIFSGIKAAEAIAAAVEGDQPALANYSETMQEAWGEDMVLAQRLAGLFYQFPKIAYRLGVKRPQAAQTMAKILAGELRYRDVTEGAIKQLKKSLIPGRG